MKHLLLYGVAVALIAVCASRAVLAHAQRGQSCQTLARVSQDAEQLVGLRHGEVTLPHRPSSGLAGKVSAALSRAGLPPSVLQSVSPESESDDKGIIRQRATLTLSGPTLPQIGKFLDAWQGSEWVVSGIDLSPSGTGTPGADLPLRAVLTLEAVFKDYPRIPMTTGGIR